MSEELEKAIEIAKSAHKGQARKNGDDYFRHLEEVASRVDEENRVAAYLHDVLEDTDMTVSMLLSSGISQENVEIIELLTKKREHTYEQYLDCVAANARAKQIKMADLISNLADKPGNKQIVKLSKSLIRLCKNDS